ncbi:MAG TPA: HupE/UreJ family protein [Polyangiaceae bacterium]|jgi:hypothetical protein|nr:HupE/UreJ family protein [Polyangiaceae bacterium]
MPRCGGAILALALVVPLFAAPVHAHSTDGRHIEATTTDSGVDLSVSTDATRAVVVAGTDNLLEREQLVSAWLTRGLEVSAAGEPCRSEAGKLVVEESRVRQSLSFECPSTRALELRDRELAAAHAKAQTLVSLDGEAHVLRPGAESMRFEERPSTVPMFIREGVVHLVTGYDHLLFVFALLLGVGLRAREHGARRAMVDAARVVTAFTVGHSITLALAALDVVVLPSALVEATIAASIVLAAVLNLWRPDTERPWLALAFGLVHGFGFSSVLAEVGLPANERVLALLSFNIGIELGQLAFVALVIAPLTWIARQRYYQKSVLFPSSLAIAAIAAVWFVERAAGA